MPYDEKLADRIREALADLPKKVEEKEMFRGITFMVDGKMCISVSADEIMCRVDPDLTDELLEKPGTRPMMRNGKIMKDYIYVAPDEIKTKKELNYWIKLCLDFNKFAKASKKPKKK